MVSKTRPAGRRSFARAAFAALLVSACAHAPSATEEAFATPTPDSGWGATPQALLARAVARPIPPDAAVEMLLEHFTVRFDAEGRRTRTLHRIFRILTPQGVKGWSTVEATWRPWYQARPEIRARVVTPSGAAHELDPATLSDAVPGDRDPDTFSDVRVLQGPLPAVEQGAVVEVVKVYRDLRPAFSAGWADRFYLVTPGPAREVDLVLDAPDSLPLHTRTLGLDLAPKVETKDGRRILRWTRKDVAAAEDPPPLLPPDVVWFPHVVYTTGKTWQDTAAAYARIVDEQIAGADLAGLVREAKGKAKDRREIVSRLLARLHAMVRYTGVEFGEAAIVPRPPQEVLERRFGDCKDKATLLVAMLRQAGLPAYVALLESGRGSDVPDDMPGLGLFDHAIVYVPGKPELWIDAAYEWSREGEVPSGDRGRHILVASPETRGLTTIPIGPSTATTYTEDRRFTLADLESASEVRETTTATGIAEQVLRDDFGGSTPEKLAEWAKGYVESTYLSEEKPTARMTDPHDLRTPFSLEVRATKAKRGFTDLQESVVYMDPEVVGQHLPKLLTSKPDDDDEARKQDLVLIWPFIEEIRYAAKPPEGFVPKAMPSNLELKVGPATLSRTYETRDDHSATARFRIDTGTGRFTPKEVEAFREAFERIVGDDGRWLKFEHAGQKAIREGHVREGLALYRKLVAEHPKSAAQHDRLAMVLLDLGFGDAARTEAEAAVKAAPKDSNAERMLAWTLQHDALGRLRAPGYDRKASIAAYRKAKALDPKDYVARADLAILLEHDTDGRRYTPGADLDGAIKEYEGIRDDLDDHRMDANYLTALFRAGRYDALLKVAEKVDAGEARNALLVAAVAMTEGPDGAVARADRLAGDAKARMKLLAATASVLFITRHYPQSAALFGVLSQGGAEPQIVALTNMLQKTRRIEDFEERPDDPAWPVVALFRATALPTSGETVTKYMTPELLGDEDLDKELDTIRAVLAQKTGDVPPAVAFDLALSNMESSTDGDAKLGYRVRMRTPAEGKEMVQSWYVVRRKGRYQIRASEFAPDDLGEEALTRLARGDLAGARKWLDWAYEILPERRGDDPLAGPTFKRLWKRGEAADAETTRLAATALAAGGHKAAKRARQTASVLEEALRADLPAEQADAVRLALVQTSAGRKDWKRVLEFGRALLQTHPDSERAFATTSMALRELDRREEFERLAKERLARNPEDVPALTALAMDAEDTGRIQEARALFGRLVDSGHANGITYNNLAWLGLFAGGPPLDEAVTDAERACRSSSYGDASSLHTLAAVYAEAGKTQEARQVLLKLLDQHTDRKPTSVDWYVVGRIAEAYDLADVARRAYGKVEKPEEPSVTDTWSLTRKRLAGLKRAP